MEWIEAINRTLSYIEDHLEDDLSMPVLARQSAYSPFYLQRTFAMMTDMTLAEYVRQRRLSMAGQALQATDAKVIDVALRFGYETPEAFQKAFRRFHGVTPAAAKKSRVQLRYLNPLHIKISLTGGRIMDYSVESIGKLYVMGREKRFPYDSAFGLIPAYWDEYYQQGWNKQVPGYIGACFDECGSSDFGYLIGSFCDESEQPPEGFVRHEIGPQLWAKFKAHGPIPGALQSLNRQIFTEWLPGNPEYEHAAPLNLEIYTEGDMSAADYESEIWIPVRRKSAK